MGTTPVRYSGGELVCIGDLAELSLPNGSVQRVRIGALDCLLNRAVLGGWSHHCDIPTLHLFDDFNPHAWFGVTEQPMLPLNPENLRLIQRSEKLYYNDGREMQEGDVVWDTGFHALYRFAGVWHRENPDYAWYFEQNENESADWVLCFEPYEQKNDGYGGYLCAYADREGNRTAAMDHISFLERGPASVAPGNRRPYTGYGGEKFAASHGEE